MDILALSGFSEYSRRALGQNLEDLDLLSLGSSSLSLENGHLGFLVLHFSLGNSLFRAVNIPAGENFIEVESTVLALSDSGNGKVFIPGLLRCNGVALLDLRFKGRPANKVAWAR